MESKIVIAGCGLSGMITALSLAHYNIPVTIVESRKISNSSFASDPRTTALNASSKRFLEKMQIWQKLESYVSPIEDIYVVDNKSNDMLHFRNSQSKKQQKMGYMIENKHFRKRLLEMVQNQPNITIIDQVEYQVEGQSEQVKIQYGNNTINADLLLVCDSRRSTIVSKYFASKIDKEYQQHALTFNVEHSKKHEYSAVEHFLPTGPFAILPLQNELHSSVVWTVPSKLQNILMSMDEEEFLFNLQENFGPFLGKIKLLTKPAAFPLKAYLSSHFVSNKIVLLADSAHVVHPLAGQGLNQGIDDIECFIQNLLLYGTDQIGLNMYEKSRIQDNLKMFYITDGFNRIFSNDSKAFFALRQAAFIAIEKISPLKSLFVEYAMGNK